MANKIFNIKFSVILMLAIGHSINCAPTNTNIGTNNNHNNHNNNNPNITPNNNDNDNPSYNTNNNNNNENTGYMAAEKIIDINNPDASDIENLQFLNISLASLRQKQLQLQLLNGYGQNGISTTPTNTEHPVPIIRISDTHTTSTRKRNPTEVTSNEELALDAIKKMIEASILRNTTNERPPELSSGDLEHYTAAHEICEIPKNTNASSWNEGNTWNLYFLPPNHRNVLMTLAVLRLYKKELSSVRPNSDCQPDDLIRITVSVYLKKKSRDRRKRLCSSIMVSRNYTGWIEFDIKTAIKIWDKPNRNMGLAVDIDDQDETPLKASSYFYPSQCQLDSRFHGLFTKTPALWTKWIPCPDIQELM